MKKILLILLLSPLFAKSQLVTMFFKGDTLWSINPSTNVETQINKTGTFVKYTDTLSMLANYQTGINNKLSTTGNGSGLTGLTASQV